MVETMRPRPRTDSEHPAAVHRLILRAVDNWILPARWSVYLLRRLLADIGAGLAAVGIAGLVAKLLVGVAGNVPLWPERPVVVRN